MLFKMAALPYGASFVAQLVKKPPAMQETSVGKIRWRRDGVPTHSSILRFSLVDQLVKNLPAMRETWV